MVSIRVLGLFALIGGALAITGVCCNWYMFVGSGIAFTGLEITRMPDLSFHFCPTVIGIMGVIMIFFGLLELTGISTKTIKSLNGTFMIIFGLATIIIPALFYCVNFLYGYDFSIILESIKIEEGMILCFIGGFLELMAGLLAVFSTDKNSS